MSGTLVRVPEVGPLERDLLLTCGRLELDPARAARLEELLRERLDWDAILWYARLHSVAPLLHHHLERSSGYEDVPRHARRLLLALYQRAAYQNGLFAQAYREIVDALAMQGTQAILPKGLALLDGVYRNPALRPLIHIDLLAPPGRAGAVMSVLQDLGYKPGSPTAVEAAYRWWGPQAYFGADRGIRIGVMVLTTLVSWPRIVRFEPAALFARAERATIAGAETQVLSPIDLALYLGISIDNLGYLNRVALGSVDPAELLFGVWTNNRLVRFTDLYEVLSRQGDRIDWELLTRRAGDGGLHQALYVSLSLTTALLGPVVPSEVLEGLRTSSRHRMRRWLFDAVHHRATGKPAPSPSKSLAGWWWARLDESSRLHHARLLSLLEVTFPSPQTLRLRYRVRSRFTLPATYALHAAYMLSRSVLSFLRGSATTAR